MNPTVPLQIIRWPHLNSVQCGVMFQNLITDEPLWLPLDPSFYVGWDDGFVRPSPEHLHNTAPNVWELRRLPTQPPHSGIRRPGSYHVRSYN